jgi:hypothetical protein
MPIALPLTVLLAIVSSSKVKGLPMKKLTLSFLSAAVFLVTTLVASAQSGGPYDLSWYTIDGGGGTSSGGSYTLSGTIGQPDAGGPMVGGSYSLTGGFWSIVSAIQTPGAPFLTVTRNANGSVSISWAQPAEGFLLDQSGVLATPASAIPWSQVGFPYQTNGGNISITVPAPAGNRYYRLRKP